MFQSILLHVCAALVLPVEDHLHFEKATLLSHSLSLFCLNGFVVQ